MREESTMPKSANQKLKLLYLMQYLLQKSNESHPVTIQQMVDELACYMALRPSAKPYTMIWRFCALSAWIY